MTVHTDSDRRHRAQHAAPRDPPAERHAVDIVVGHDGLASGDAALAAAVALAAPLGAHLHVVHSVTVDDYGVDPDTDGFEEERDRRLAEERAQVADALARAEVAWTYHEQRGDPARRLAELADEVDAAFLVVGGPHGGMMHHLLGGESVSRRLLHVQPRPVLVVPVPRR